MNSSRSVARQSLIIILIGVLLSPLLSYRTVNNEWILIKVDSIASVQFPGQATFQTMDPVKAYSMRTQDLLLLVMVIDQENKLEQHPEKDVYSFYLGVMDSMIRETKSTLIDSASFHIDKYRGMGFSYFGPSTNGSNVRRIVRAVLIKNKLYCWGYTVLGQETESSKALSKRFIESFSVK
ncbi:MAG: hypothetical protein ACK5PC_17215 [Cyclobacteriaceae bacterium]|jgi:hypothetical protein